MRLAILRSGSSENAGPEPSEFFFLDVPCHFPQWKLRKRRARAKTPGQSHPNSSFWMRLTMFHREDATKMSGESHPNSSFWMCPAILRSGNYENAGPAPSEFFFLDVPCHFAQWKLRKRRARAIRILLLGCALPFCAVEATKTPGQSHPNSSFWMCLAILHTEDATKTPGQRHPNSSFWMCLAILHRGCYENAGLGPRRLCAGRVLRFEVCITFKQLSNSALLPYYLSSRN